MLIKVAPHGSKALKALALLVLGLLCLLLVQYRNQHNAGYLALTLELALLREHFWCDFSDVLPALSWDNKKPAN